MTRWLPAAVVAVGVVLVAVGLWWSPVPWLAPIVVGAVLVTAGLLVDVEGGDDDASAGPPDPFDQ